MPAQPHLTPREHELLTALCTGCCVKEAADLLRMSPRTAQWHLRRLFTRHSVHSLLELLTVLGCVHPPAKVPGYASRDPVQNSEKI